MFIHRDKKLDEFIIKNAENKTAKELALLTGMKESKIKSFCAYRKIKIKPDDGNSILHNKFFNVYERENWVI